jgi:hypothetical protein
LWGVQPNAYQLGISLDLIRSLKSIGHLTKIDGALRVKFSPVIVARKDLRRGADTSSENFGNARAAPHAAERRRRSNIPAGGGADVGFLPFPIDRVIA